MTAQPAADPYAVIEEAIEENARARAELLEAIDALSEEQRLEVWYDGWSVKDIVAHLAAWQNAVAVGLEHIARGERPSLPGYEGDDDRFNELNTSAVADEPWEHIMAGLRAARERHEAAARNLRDAGVEPDRLEEGKTAHRFLFHSGGHEREHIPAILEWRRERGI
jgi:hypothetical protein